MSKHISHARAARVLVKAMYREEVARTRLAAAVAEREKWWRITDEAFKRECPTETLLP